MEKAAIGTNDLGMHIVIRPISKDLLSKDEIIGMETGKINSLLTARRPITLVDAITALPPLLIVSGIILSCKKDPGSNSEVFLFTGNFSPLVS